MSKYRLWTLWNVLWLRILQLMKAYILLFGGWGWGVAVQLLDHLTSIMANHYRHAINPRAFIKGSVQYQLRLISHFKRETSPLRVHFDLLL